MAEQSRFYIEFSKTEPSRTTRPDGTVEEIGGSLSVKISGDAEESLMAAKTLEQSIRNNGISGREALPLRSADPDKLDGVD